MQLMTCPASRRAANRCGSDARVTAWTLHPRRASLAETAAPMNPPAPRTVNDCLSADMIDADPTASQSMLLHGVSKFSVALHASRALSRVCRVRGSKLADDREPAMTLRQPRHCL